MEKVGMIDEYIYPYYEQLHSESRENLTESLIDTLNRWEKDLCVKNSMIHPQNYISTATTTSPTATSSKKDCIRNEI